DTPYMTATSTAQTYLTERFKDYPNGVHITLQGEPRSILADYEERHF
ncbi:PhoH family protein, partial [Pseudomonas syringae pv. tagetis]